MDFCKINECAPAKLGFINMYTNVDVSAMFASVYWQGGIVRIWITIIKLEII
jgi:hypothetical protein